MKYVLRKVAYIVRRPLWAAWWWWGGYKMWREDMTRRASFRRAFIAPWTAAHWTTTTQEERTMLAARG